MLIIEVLNLIQQFAKNQGFSTPLICGGIPRDYIFTGKVTNPSDIDLTSLAGDSVDLAYAVHKDLPEFKSLKIFDDGHASIILGKARFDFSNHFLVPEVERLLAERGINNASPIVLETYSRDFTINALLVDIAFKNIYDVTSMGINDCKNKILRSCLDPDVSIPASPKRIIRAVKFLVKYDLRLDLDLQKAIIKHVAVMDNVSNQYISRIVNECLKINKEKTINVLLQLNLFNQLKNNPSVRRLALELQKNPALRG